MLECLKVAVLVNTRYILNNNEDTFGDASGLGQEEIKITNNIRKE
jgi:hypothetical protein